MVMETIVGVIALAFIILVVFLIMTLHKAQVTLKKADKTLNDLHKMIEKYEEPGLELLKHVDKLTKDIVKKSEALDVLFRPLYAKKKEEGTPISEVVGFVTDGISIFNRIKDYVKSR